MKTKYYTNKEGRIFKKSLFGTLKIWERGLWEEEEYTIGAGAEEITKDQADLLLVYYEDPIILYKRVRG